MGQNSFQDVAKRSPFVLFPNPKHHTHTHINRIEHAIHIIVKLVFAQTSEKIESRNPVTADADAARTKIAALKGIHRRQDHSGGRVERDYVCSMAISRARFMSIKTAAASTCVVGVASHCIVFRIELIYICI